MLPVTIMNNPHSKLETEEEPLQERIPYIAAEFKKPTRNTH